MLTQLLIFGLIAAAANVAGGLVLFPAGSHHRYKRVLKYLLAIGAGFMLSVTLFEIFPRTVVLWQPPGGALTTESLAGPMILVLAGYLLTQFLEHTIAPHFHLGEEMHCSEHEHELISPRTAYTAVGGLLVHTFFDGVAIAAATQLDTRAGLLVFVAIFLHKFPEGFTIGSMVLASGAERSRVLISTSLIGLTTLFGVLTYYFIGSDLGFTVAYALPVAAGVTLYVAASDLIPEVNHHGEPSPLVSVSIFAGVALFFAAHQLLHAALGE